MHTYKNQNHLTECDIIFQNRKKHVFCKHYILILHFKQSFTFVHMIGTIFFYFFCHTFTFTQVIGVEFWEPILLPDVIGWIHGCPWKSLLSPLWHYLVHQVLEKVWWK